MCTIKFRRAFDRFPRTSVRFSRFLPLTFALLVTATGASAQHANHPVCQKIANHQLQASAGAQIYCFGPQPSGPARPLSSVLLPNTSVSGPVTGDTFGKTNLDAANPLEDQNNGTQAYGQSETSIATAGPYVVEAWNDASGFFAPCPSPNNKEEFTGFAFSSDGGSTFTDMGGLPNADCNFRYEGDPSVEVYQVEGNTYFYISSIFIPFTMPANDIAITACQVLQGSPATLSCGQPIVAATSSECLTPIPGSTFCSFLDKDFLSIDPVHGRLYVSYTDFGFVTHPDDVDLAVCDLTSPAAPVCDNGSGAAPQPAYLTLASSFVCEIEGSYPAVDAATGDVYVGHESNWFTNQFSPCNTVPVQNVLHYVPASCLTFPTASCSGPAASTAVDIVSTDTTVIAGYNRGTGNDFPRVAVSDANGTVSMVWNDTHFNPMADVLLQSFDLVSLTPVQAAPVKLNNDSASGTGTLHFLPALRNADANGNLNVSWYDRRLNPSSALTDVFAALGVNPRTTSTPKSNVRVTNASSNWLVVSSDIVPNFGDYTDNYIEMMSGKGLTATIFAAWSDGRINDPQPFCAHQGLK